MWHNKIYRNGLTVCALNIFYLSANNATIKLLPSLLKLQDISEITTITTTTTSSVNIDRSMNQFFTLLLDRCTWSDAYLTICNMLVDPQSANISPYFVCVRSLHIIILVKTFNFPLMHFCNHLLLQYCCPLLCYNLIWNCLLNIEKYF